MISTMEDVSTTVQILLALLSALAILAINWIKMDWTVQVRFNWTAYKWNITIHMKMSLDINECLEEDLNDCDGNATCSDNDGGYSCSCNTGYMGNGTRGNCFGKHLKCFVVFLGEWCAIIFIIKCCVDLNECENFDTNNCHVNASCMNTIGSFYCSCFDGFLGNGVNCSGKLIAEHHRHVISLFPFFLSRWQWVWTW